MGDGVTAHDMRKARIANLEALASNAFAYHIVRSRHGGIVVGGLTSWIIGAPDHGNHAAEIVLLGFNSILVHGDCPDVLFCGGDGGADVDRLVWLAGGSLDYIASKIRAGERRCFDEEIARAEIAEMLAARCTCNPPDVTECAWCRDLTPVLDECRGMGQAQYAAAIYEASGDAEDCDVGWVVSSDVVYTRQAVRRFIELEWPERVKWGRS